MMKDKILCIVLGFSLLPIVSCTSRKSLKPDNISAVDSIAVIDSLRSDFDGPPPPPPHGKDRPPHKPDNMRGFDPASEDDMDDNGMSRYMENNDEEGWD